MHRLRGRIAVVTGGASGIGRAISVAFAREGASVAVLDLREEAAASAAAEAGEEGRGYGCDVASPEAVRRTFEAVARDLGAVDVLVNNAGIDIIKPVEEVTGEEYQQIIDINLSGYFHCSQFAGRHMLEHGGGSIINNSSIASVAGIHGLVAYSAAKGGVNMLTRVMAAEWATRGVRVNAIAPGYFDNIMRDAGAEHARPEKQEQVKRFTPMQRRGLPDELVGPVLFLASDASSYVTGNILFVDGGYTAI